MNDEPPPERERCSRDRGDHAASQRLELLDDVYRLYRCRTIMNCTEVCPKVSILRKRSRIKIELLRRSVRIRGGITEYVRKRTQRHKDSHKAV